MPDRPPRPLRAMLLAAGRGERMRPLTDALPKPLLEAGGRSLIGWHLQRLAASGIRDLVINHAWLGERLEEAIGNGAADGLSIRWSREGTALETAGGIARALPLLTDGPDDDLPFLVISADVHCDFDLGRAHTVSRQMLAAQQGCWCVMVDNPAHHARGDFRLRDGQLGLAAAGDQTFTYSGIGLFRPSLFRGITTGERLPLRPILDRAIASGRAAGERHGGLWFDVGTPERLAVLNRLLGSDAEAGRGR